MTSIPVLVVSDLSKSYGHHQVLKNINFEIERGEVVAVIGPSGCGKSTLLRCLTWLEQPEAGEIRLAGKPFGAAVVDGVRKPQPRHMIDAMRPSIGMVFQQFHLWPHLSAVENIVRPQTVVLKRTAEDARTRAMKLLGALGLAGNADKLPNTLSGGQRQRVAIARAMAMDPELLLFDEPTAALDAELVGDLLKLLRGLASQGTTMVVVTHDIGFARAVADRAIFLEKGRVVEDGPIAQIFGEEVNSRVTAFIEGSASR